MIKINISALDFFHFPDNTCHINCQYDVFKTSPQLIEWYYEDDAEVFRVYACTKHLQNLGYEVALYLPYIPNARMDRTKSETEVFTLKWFADLINSLNFTSVVVLDPHSNVSPALFDRVVIAEPANHIARAIAKSNPDVIFFPDEGAMKRYTDLIFNDCLGRAFGMKKRDWKTGTIQGLDIYGDNVAGKNVLIVDDICSKGGTFYHSARKLKEAGAASISLYITHCEHTIFDGELLKDNGLIDKIYTTDSLFHSTHEKIEVFEV